MIDYIGYKVLDLLSSKWIGRLDWAGDLYQRLGGWLCDRALSKSDG